MDTTFAAVRGQLSDFFELTKPGIITLVLVTAFAGMWLAAGGFPPFEVFFKTLAGVGLASAGSAVLNNYIDRDIDPLMERTRQRVLPSGRMSPQQVLVFGSVLSASGFLVLYAFVNALSAWLVLLSLFFYIGIYTSWLKRRSPWCTEVGGVAGAMPPVIGWAAVSNTISTPALLLFLIMMLWQPPHFWVLALRRCEEYRRAGVPLLPVVSGEQATKNRMLVYTVLLVPAAVAFYFTGLVGPIYLLAAVVLGLVYIKLTIDFMREAFSVKSSQRLFGFSIVYLLLLFAVMVFDCHCTGMRLL